MEGRPWERERLRGWNQNRWMAVPAIAIVLVAGVFLAYFSVFRSSCGHMWGKCEFLGSHVGVVKKLDAIPQQSIAPGGIATPSVSSETLERLIDRDVAKSRWVVAMLLCFISFLGAGVLSANVVKASLSARWRRRGLRLFAALPAAVLSLAAVYVYVALRPLVRAEGEEELRPVEGPIDLFRRSALETHDEVWLLLLNVGGVLALAMLTAAAAACVRPSDLGRTDGAGRDQAGLALRRQLRWLDGVFYIGAVSLLAVAFQVSALYRLIFKASHGAGPVDGAAAASTAASYAGVLSLALSAVLAALYVPAAFILHRRASAYADWAIEAPEERRAWLESYNLRGTWWERGAHVLAVVAPALVGGSGGLPFVDL